GPRTEPPVEIASVPLTMAGADLENLLLTTSPGGSVTGRTVFEDAAPPARAPNMRVMALALNPDDGAGVPSPQPAEVAADWTFTLKGLLGEYGLRTAIPNQYVKTVTVN